MPSLLCCKTIPSLPCLPLVSTPSRWPCLILALCLVFLWPARLHAATGTWSTNSGTWDTGTNNWSGVSGTPWDSINGLTNIANFTATSGSATVSGTVYANQITYTAGSGSFSIDSGTINLAGTTPTISVNTSRVLTIGSALEGSAGLVKTGAGFLTLTASNTYSGTTTISAGTLRIADANALGAGGAGNATTIGTGGDLSLQGNITVAGEALTHNGGTGGFLRNLSGTNAWNGDITVGANNSRIRSDAGLLTIGGNINIASTGLIFEGAGNTTVSGIVSGTGALTLGGGNSGTVTLSGLNSYTGATTVGAGTLSINTLTDWGVDSSIGKGTNTGQIFLGSGANDGTILYTGSGNTSNRRFRIGNTTAADTGGAVIKNDGSGALVLNNVFFNTANTSVTTSRTLTLGGANTDTNTISGSISDNATALGGTVAVTKTDAGTWVLSGSNSYTGGTTVSAGSLIINGNNSNATGVLSVASGATLGGSGTIGGATTISGVLAPGNSICTLTVANDVTWNSGNSWVFELGGAGPTISSPGTSDLLAITGGNDFLKGTGAPGSFTFDFAGSATSDGWYKLVDWTGGTTGFDTADFVGVNLGGVYTSEFAIQNNALYVNVVPEPSTYALLALAAVGLGTRILRRLRL